MKYPNSYHSRLYTIKTLIENFKRVFLFQCQTFISISEYWLNYLEVIKHATICLLYTLMIFIVKLLYCIKNASLVLFSLTATSDESFFSFFLKHYHMQEGKEQKSLPVPLSKYNSICDNVK